MNMQSGLHIFRDKYYTARHSVLRVAKLFGGQLPILEIVRRPFYEVTEGFFGETFHYLGLPMVVACTHCQMTHTFFSTWVDEQRRFFCTFCGLAAQHEHTMAQPPALATDPRVTLIANTLLAIRKHESFIADEISAFDAPSECASLLYKTIRKDILQAFIDNKMTQEEFDAGLRAKISHKAAYQLGL
jgi:hypothetical protein